LAIVSVSTIFDTLSVKFDVMPNSALAAGFIIKPEPSLKLGKAERVCAAIQNAAIKFLWSNPFRDMTVNKLMAETSVGGQRFTITLPTSMS
jgi:hypothetical protein